MVMVYWLGVSLINAVAELVEALVAKFKLIGKLSASYRLYVKEKSH